MPARGGCPPKTQRGASFRLGESGAGENHELGA